MTTQAGRPREEKRWQPVNTALALLIAGCILYFTWNASAALAIARSLPVLVLLLTRRNNVFAAIVLLVFGLTIVLLPTLDAFFLLVAAAYMFSSALLRMLGVKRHVAIGLVIASALGLWVFNALAVEKMQTFVAESSVTLTRAVNGRSGIVLSPTGMPPSGEVKDVATAFNPGQTIYPVEQGVQKGGEYACRVIGKTGEVVIPLDKWPVFKIEGDGDVAQRGTLNDGVHSPLRVGEYTIQLVKLADKQGTIIAEREFSIVPYDDQTVSQVVAYLTSEKDPGQRFDDSYTVKTDDFNVTAWVQGPKGKTISGRVRFFKTTHDGVVEATAWDGEHSFTTDPSGEPRSVQSMSGRIPPGIYHFRILVNDKTLRDLRLII